MACRGWHGVCVRLSEYVEDRNPYSSTHSLLIQWGIMFDCRTSPLFGGVSAMSVVSGQRGVRTSGDEWGQMGRWWGSEWSSGCSPRPLPFRPSFPFSLFAFNSYLFVLSPFHSFTLHSHLGHIHSLDQPTNQPTHSAPIPSLPPNLHLCSDPYFRAVSPKYPSVTIFVSVRRRTHQFDSSQDQTSRSFLHSPRSCAILSLHYT